MKSICFVWTFLCFSISLQALEPLQDSSAVYESEYRLLNFNKADRNQDGRIDKSDSAKEWQRAKRLDANQDGWVDWEEWQHVSIRYINSPGQQLRNVLYKRTESQNLFLDFYFPDVDESAQKPVVIYTHGGGWAAGSKHGASNSSFAAVHTQLLRQGFCVAAVQYRLCQKGGSIQMRDCVIDAKDAIRFLAAHHKSLGIDPMKIYTFGDSAGGHLAQMLLLSPADSLTGDAELAQYAYQTVAGVSWYGPCDFEDEQLFNHNDRKPFKDRFGARILGQNTRPEEKLSLYREMSPVNYVSPASPPLLMIQGDRDTTIPVKHLYRMQEKLAEVTAPFELLIVKNAGHNWKSVDAPIVPSRDEIIEQTVAFLVNHQR